MKRLILTVILIQIFLYLSSQNACSQIVSSNNHVLNFSIKSDKEVYELGEKICLQLEITNNSPLPVVFNSRCYYTYLEVKDPFGNILFAKEKKIIFPPPKEADFITILSGQSWSSNFESISPYEDKIGRFPSLSGAYNFNNPGKYIIKAIYKNNYKTSFDVKTGDKKFFDAWVGTIISNSISIEIVKKELGSNVELKISLVKLGMHRDEVEKIFLIRDGGPEPQYKQGKNKKYLPYMVYYEKPYIKIKVPYDEEDKVSGSVEVFRGKLIRNSVKRD